MSDSTLPSCGLCIKLLASLLFRSFLLSALLLTIFQPRVLFGQTTSATLTGNVSDASGATVPGAAVVITDTDTGTKRTVQTNNAGLYTAPQLAAGRYSLTISKSGFKTTTQSGIALEINQSATVNVMLAVGSVDETLEVTAAPPILQTETVSLGTVVDTRQVSDLPLNGRQFSQLLELSPGTVPVNVGQNLAPTVGSGIVVPSVNGQSNRANLTFIDGVLTTDNLFSSFSVSPSIDAIQAFQVQSHAVDAQYGQSTGGTFNIATKAGSNKFHGTAYEFFRNQALNAVPYFLKSNNQFSLNDFGGTIGGPIKKDKLFFFGYYEGVRQSQSSTVQSILPTPAELSGDFSALLPTTVIYDPTSYNAITHAIQAFPGNKIPSNRLNAGILAVMTAYVPQIAPNSPANAINYQNTTPSSTDQDQWGARADYIISQKDVVYGRFIWNKSNSVSPNTLAGNSFVSNYNDKNLSVGYTRSQSSTLTIQLNAGMNLFDYPLYNVQPNAQQTFDTAGFAAGFTSTPGGIGVPYIPGIHPSGFFSVTSGWGGQGQNNQSLYQASGTVSKLAGKHTFQVGAAYYWSKENGNYSEDDENFNQQATANPCASTDATGNCVAAGGNSLASMLLGLPVSATRQLGSSLNVVHNNVLGFFAEDSWKLSNQMTVNYGLRWDYSSPPVEDQNRFGGFDIHTSTWIIAQGNPATPNPLPAGVAILPRNTFTIPDYKDWSPRLGFNYHPTATTAILGSAGLFYDNWAGLLQGAQNSRGGWPNGASQNSNNTNIAGVTPDATAQNPFGSLQPVLPTTPFPSGGTFLDSNFKDAYSWEWNLQIQQQMGHTSIFSLAYVGSSTSRSPISRPANESLILGPTLRLPFPNMSQFSSLESAGHNKYNALEASFQKRYSKGLAVTGAVTWSHTLDAGCSDLFVNCNIQNGYDLRQERSNSSLDVPVVATASVVYALPVGHGQTYLSKGVAGAILGNWQVNGLLIARSGTPFTTTINNDNANANGGTQRPNVIGNPYAGSHTIAHFFNTAAFEQAPLYQFGTAGRNSLRGPHFTNVDLSLFRYFPIWHEHRAEFRAEAFNLFNHPQFANPDGVLQDPTFGQITATTGNPREIQLAVKYTF